MFWVALAVLLYLAPIVGLTLARAKADRSLPAVALDLVAAFAFDLLAILLVTRFLPLGLATFAVRAVQLPVLAFLLFRKRSVVASSLRSSWSSRGAVVALTVLVGVLLSRTMTVPYALWDRQWHIPLVASLRGQTLPFLNVYENGGKLYYHHAGDALAAIFQALSFNHVHASAALSRVHDVLFALTACFIAGVAPAFGIRRAVPTLAFFLVLATMGPNMLLRDGLIEHTMGQSFLNFLTISLRPHTPIAWPLILAMFAALFLPLIQPAQVRARDARPALFLSTALLTLSDEPSLGVIGVLCGVFWLVNFQSFHPRRLPALALLLGLLFTVGASSLAFGGTFSPGAHRQKVELVKPRLPGIYQGDIGFDSPEFWEMLLQDHWLAVFTTLAGLVVLGVRRDRGALKEFAIFSSLVVVSLGLLFSIRINGSGTECHRFVTCLMLLSPLFGAHWAFGSGARPERRGAHQVVVGCVAVALVLPSLSTLQWLRGGAQSDAHNKGFWGNDLFYRTDCRLSTAAPWAERARVTYVTEELWYLYTGCRPVFAPGPEPGTGEHAIAIGTPRLGIDGLKVAHAWLPVTERLKVVCKNEPTPQDEVCKRVRGLGLQSRVVGKLREYELGAAERRALSGG